VTQAGDDESGQELQAQLLQHALRHFNAGEYHTAHEILDRLWEGPEGPDTAFYKGLIQAAICLHHFSCGNLEGARKLYSGHRRYLAEYLPRHCELDLVRFLEDMQACLRPVLRAPPQTEVPFEPSRRPQLSLD